MKGIFKDILNLFFPRICCTCGESLVENEEIICFRCRIQLPKANFINPLQNELKDRFFGKIELEYAFAGLYFYKSGITQVLMHQFKYQNQPEIGLMLGRWTGTEINDVQVSNKIDYIIPIPLHPKKERKRGYNQSYYFANGLSEITGIPVLNNGLKRVKNTESQTGKSREMRWLSVMEAFAVGEPERLNGKHILIVDDVVTTGSTIESCGKTLLNSGAGKLSVATMAIAK